MYSKFIIPVVNLSKSYNMVQKKHYCGDFMKNNKTITFTLWLLYVVDLMIVDVKSGMLLLDTVII